MSHRIGIFISHSWKFSGHYEKLSEWIFEERWNSNGVPIEFVNYSVPKDNPIHFARTDRELQAAISERIKPCDVVVCPTGMYSTHSKWIGKELAALKHFKKPLLAVNPWAQEMKSRVVRDAADEVVGWTSKSVVNGIWNLRHHARRY